MFVASFTLMPLLRGSKVVVEAPYQRRPLQTLIGTMDATMAQPETKIAPEMLGEDTAQAAMVGRQLRQRLISYLPQAPGQFAPCG